MKKTIAILLVAIMAVGSVFALDATLSGKFTSKFAYDLEDNWLGFTEPDNNLDLTLSVATEKENEGDIYAVVKAELTLAYNTAKPGDPMYDEDYVFDTINLNDDDSKFEITEASIYGNGWNVSILKAAEMPKYAKGWETYNDGDDSIDLNSPVSYKNDIGLTVTVDNLLKAGVALDADFDENEGKNALVWVSTNDLNFAGIVVNGAVGFKKVANDPLAYLGLGLEAGYETDTLSATVASDMSFGIPTEKDIDSKVYADVAVNVNYADMVTADVYYATDTKLGDGEAIDTYEEDRLFAALSAEVYFSAKVGFDMNAFDVPVKLTLAAMDIANNPYFDLEAATSISGFDVTAFAGYQYLKDLGKSNAIHVGAEVAYTIDQIGKLSVGTTFGTVLLNKDEWGTDDSFNSLSLDIAPENTTLVSGATLKAGYTTDNLLDNEIFGMKFETADMGEIYVSATIEF